MTTLDLSMELAVFSSLRINAGHVKRPVIWFIWDFGSPGLSVDLGTEFKQVTNQSCLHNASPVKTLNAKTQVRFPVDNTLYTLSNLDASGEICSDYLGRKCQKLYCTFLIWLILVCILPSSYALTVVQQPSVSFVNHCTLLKVRVVWDSMNLQLTLKVRMALQRAILSNCVIWLSMGVYAQCGTVSAFCLDCITFHLIL